MDGYLVRLCSWEKGALAMRGFETVKIDEFEEGWLAAEIVTRNSKE